MQEVLANVLQIQKNPVKEILSAKPESKKDAINFKELLESSTKTEKEPEAQNPEEKNVSFVREAETVQNPKQKLSQKNVQNADESKLKPASFSVAKKPNFQVDEKSFSDNFSFDAGFFPQEENAIFASLDLNDENGFSVLSFTENAVPQEENISLQNIDLEKEVISFADEKTENLQEENAVLQNNFFATSVETKTESSVSLSDDSSFDTALLASGQEVAEKPILKEEKNLVSQEKNLFKGTKNQNKKEVILEVPEEGKMLFSVVDERTKIEEKDVKIALEAKNDVSLASGEQKFTQGFQDILSSDSQSAAANGSVFQEMLSNQIAFSAEDFVKAGNMVLRDNNSGTINLILRPESLGNVKINLELSDKILEAHITVQSKEAYEAFKQNLSSLKQAFQENGFDSARFDLNLADSAFSSGAFAQSSGKEQGGDKFFSARAYGDFAEGSDSALSLESQNPSEAQYAAISDYKIDVVA